MATLNIEIKADNAAFDDDPSIETARLLRELADSIERMGLGYHKDRLQDINGNHVGYANWEGDE